MRYAGALHLKVKRAVGDLLLTIKAQHPQYTDESMSIVFLPVEHTHKALRFEMDDPEAMPEPAHAAFEDSDDNA